MKKRSSKGKGYFYAMGQRDAINNINRGDRLYGRVPLWAVCNYFFGLRAKQLST